MNRSTLLGMAAGGIAGLSSVSTARAQTDDIADTLTSLNAKLQLATKNFDVDTLSKLITDDYELVSSTGKVYDRAAFLADAADRSITYELNEPEDVAVRHYNGDCAIVTAVLHVRFRTATKTVDVRIRYGDVWVKLNGQWRYAYGEASPIKTT